MITYTVLAINKNVYFRVFQNERGAKSSTQLFNV